MLVRLLGFDRVGIERCAWTYCEDNLALDVDGLRRWTLTCVSSSLCNVILSEPAAIFKL